MRLSAIAFAVVLIAACSSDEQRDNKSADVEDMAGARVEAAKSNITIDFFDPDSAQFRKIVEKRAISFDRRTIEILCGEVNGKNRLGAYVGFQPFVTVLNVPESSALPEAEDWRIGDTLIFRKDFDKSDTRAITNAFIENVIWSAACEADRPQLPEMAFALSADNFRLAERPAG